MIPGSANPLLLKSAAAAAGGYQVSRSLRFNSSDSGFCSRAVTSTGNRTTFTLSLWVKRSSFNTYQRFFSSLASGRQMLLRFNNDNTLLFEDSVTASSFATSQVCRDPSAWAHIVLAIDTTQATSNNRIKVYFNGTQITTFASTAYPTQNSNTSVNLSGDTMYLGGDTTGEYVNGYLAEVFFIDGQQLTPSSFTEVSATTGQLIPKAYTGSFGTNGFWLKFSDNSAATAATLGKDYSGNSNNWTPNNFALDRTQPNYIGSISFENCSLGGGSIANGFDTSTSTFFNTTNATNSTIVFAPTVPITINSSLVFYGALGGNQGWSVKIGSITLASGQNEPGSPYTIPNAAGKTISSSDPLRLISDGAGEGVYLSALVVDGLLLVNAAGAGNDSLVDTPTSFGTDTGVGGEVRGNYATLNPLKSAGTLSNGNLQITTASSSTWENSQGTFGVSSGKWYWEITISGVANYHCLGVASPTKSLSTSYQTLEYGIWMYDARAFLVGEGGSYPSYGSTYSSGDIIGVALDSTAGTLVFYKNGVSQGTAFTTGLAGVTVVPQLGVYNAGTANTQIANFGQRAFAYTAPSGFKALVDTNLPTPVVAKPNTLFDVVTRTFTGASASITSLAFAPDFLWFKRRNDAASHSLFDSVRGVSGRLLSNGTNAEITVTDALTSFDSNGFTLGVDSGSISVNGPSSGTGVVWAWDAGTSTVSNTAGSITSQVRANVSAGFSICTFSIVSASATISTFGHGLGVAPSFVIFKVRNAVDEWTVYHGSISSPTSNWVTLNTTNAAGGGTSTFSTSSTTFGVRETRLVASSGSGNILAYCFAPVVGYSSFGSYVGNGSADGPFVFLGFRPRWVLVKNSNNTDGWSMWDAARDPYNEVIYKLEPNSSGAEGSNSVHKFDFLSNGFKVRGTWNGFNGSGNTIIYAAFAENPFQYARAR